MYQKLGGRPTGIRRAPLKVTSASL